MVRGGRDEMVTGISDDSKENFDKYITSLSAECRKSINRHSMVTSVTSPQDRQLLEQVVGNGGNAEGYLYGGFTATVGVRAALKAIGTSLSHFQSILDFGCGSGRLIRWFEDLTPNTRLAGTDINNAAIEWCRENIPYA